MTFLFRTSDEPARTYAAIRRAVYEIDSRNPISAMGSLTAYIGGRLPELASYVAALLALAGVAVLLAAMGVYGITSYALEQRTKEIAIRIALGADRRQMAALIGGSTAMLAAIGVAIGLLVSLTLGRAIETQLWNVSAHDPQVLAGTAVLLGAMAALACLPAVFRATRVDPATSLRDEGRA